MSDEAEYNRGFVAGVRKTKEWETALESKLAIAVKALEKISSWNCAAEGVGYDMSDISDEALKEIGDLSK